MKKFILWFLSFVFISYSFGGTISLVWDPVQDQDVQGYRIHYGVMSGTYDHVQDAGNVTSYTLNNLSECVRYYIAVTAYDVSGNESAYSNEVNGLPKPIITSVSPSAAEQGRTLSVIINGYNYENGATVGTSNPGITILSTTFLSCTQMMSTFIIAENALIGFCEVKVKNPGGIYGSSLLAFEVLPSTPPQIISTSPADGSTNIPVNVHPTITFSEALDPSSVSSSTIILLDSNSAAVPQAPNSPLLDGSGMIASIVPLINLNYGSVYRIKVAGGVQGIKDLAGHPMSTDFVQSVGFTATNDATPPAISNVATSNITSTSADVTWNTDEPADSIVEYKVSGSPTYNQTTLDAALVASHLVRLSGLDPGTIYLYHAVSKDEYGNRTTSSPDKTFTTLADTTPPVISNLASSNITSTSADVTWNTDEPADSMVEYKVSGSPTYNQTMLDAALVASHIVHLSGLDPGTIYLYHAVSKDKYGNRLTSSPDKTFTTLADTTPPIVSNVISSNITSTSADITWSTDEPADSMVEYKASADSYYSQTPLDTTLVTSHLVHLENLDPGTLYYCYVVSKDANANKSQSRSKSFATLTDTSPPEISNVAFSNVTSTSADITWSTDESADSVVNYKASTASSYSQTMVIPDMVTSHTVHLTGLDPDTLYSCHVISKDASGNSAMSSPDISFRTNVSPYSYTSIEAEEGELQSPLQIGSDANPPAFLNMFIYAPPGSNPGGTGSPFGRASYDFYVPVGGSFTLWMRIYSTDSLHSSFWANVNSGTSYIVSASTFGSWEWVRAQTHVLTAGLNHLDLAGRDEQAEADRILFTNDPDFIPGATPTDDRVAPSPVLNFSATPGDSQNVLSWVNPPDPDLKKTIVRYRVDGEYPKHPEDGFPVCARSGNPSGNDSFIHTGLANNTVYSYSAFAVDGEKNASDESMTSGKPQKNVPPGQVRNNRRKDKRQ